MNKDSYKKHVVVIGGGFTGLAAAYEIARRGFTVTILEKEKEIGGLAGSFKIGKQRLERFYHHWFCSDQYVFQLAREIGSEEQLQYRPTKMGIFLDNKILQLSTPFDLLQFKPLAIPDRIRLGLLILRARRVKDWKQLESLTAEEWLLKLCGREVFRVVWEPLLRGKFGPFASNISAVWLWNKLVLRGGSRSKTGKEVLAYYDGGFAAFIETIADKIKALGGLIQTDVPVESLVVQDGCVTGVQTPKGIVNAQAVILTPSLPIIADLLKPHVSKCYIDRLKRIEYLANVCLVLEVSRSLSDIYWLNVSEKDFPFVGLIEHCNFQSPETYGGKHIVYLSTYLLETAELYNMSENQVFEFSLPYLKRIFPKFDRSWVRNYKVWKARYAQPVVTPYFNSITPSSETPIERLYISTMAQIYPEDRGTNYAIQQGRRIGRIVAKRIANEGVERDDKFFYTLNGG
jgi:protoporphyrinogen oxidase